MTHEDTTQPETPPTPQDSLSLTPTERAQTGTSDSAPAGAQNTPQGTAQGTPQGAAQNTPQNPPPSNTYSSFYEAVGGEETFRRITREFYRLVRTDDILGPMYPEDDFEGAEDRLRLFLAQYWGGPQTYSEQRGHPRLRMRHAQFPIDTAARDRWLELFARALATVDRETLDDPHRAAIWDHAERVANMLINRAS